MYAINTILYAMYISGLHGLQWLTNICTWLTSLHHPAPSACLTENSSHEAAQGVAMPHHCRFHQHFHAHLQFQWHAPKCCIYAAYMLHAYGGQVRIEPWLSNYSGCSVKSAWNNMKPARIIRVCKQVAAAIKPAWEQQTQLIQRKRRKRRRPAGAVGFFSPRH